MGNSFRRPSFWPWRKTPVLQDQPSSFFSNPSPIQSETIQNTNSIPTSIEKAMELYNLLDKNAKIAKKLLIAINKGDMSGIQTIVLENLTEIQNAYQTFTQLTQSVSFGRRRRRRSRTTKRSTKRKSRRRSTKRTIRKRRKSRNKNN